MLIVFVFRFSELLFGFDLGDGDVGRVFVVFVFLICFVMRGGRRGG